jgi:hypothetical protein
MQSQGYFDMKHVICWGFSAGAVRAGHTHAPRLAGAVGRGTGTNHFFFSSAWLEKAKDHEYLWTTLQVLAEKFGYKDGEERMDKAQEESSLIETEDRRNACYKIVANQTVRTTA